KTYAASRPAWKVLRVLGNFLHLDGFNYESSEEIHHEVKTMTEKNSQDTYFLYEPHELNISQKMITRIGEVPIYAMDSLVRHSQPLQETQSLMEGDMTALRIHPDTAAKLHIMNGEKVQVKQQLASVLLPVIFDTRIA